MEAPAPQPTTSAARKRYEPPIPRRDIQPADWDTARRLHRALGPSLLRMKDPMLACAAMELKGVEDYRAEFGHVITTRHFRRLLHRTVERDAGLEKWMDLDLYLPDTFKRKAPIKETEQFAAIETTISLCADPSNPSKAERCAIWTSTFEEHDRIVGEGTPRKKAARQLRAFLSDRAPFLAASRDALLKAFNSKLAAYLKSGRDVKALRDRRENNSGNHDNYTFPQEDQDLLTWRAARKHGGRIAPAWWELLHGGEFTEQTISRYLENSTNPSHVPHLIMEAVRAEVEILTIMLRGPRAFDSIKGHITRSYEGISSLQCMMADDFTMPVYFYKDDGAGWFELTRGQVLLFNDFRTHRILGWSLQPDRNYNSRVIRSLCTHVFGEFGVPQVLYFERGIWQTAKLLKGSQESPCSLVEISQGLREFGIKFIHAIRPRSKTVERIGEAVQRLMEGEPGYCGRDERKDAPESLRKQMAEVEARKVHPSKYFYSYEQWIKRLGEIIAAYNSAPQFHSRIIGPLSPEAAFEKHLNLTDPPMQFSAGIRFLLANHKEVRPVTMNGVTLQFGKVKFTYRGAQISHLVGRQALAWFDPENPDVLALTDLNHKNPICVPRAQEVNALENIIQPESGAALQSELNAIKGQSLHMAARFSILKTKFKLPQRHNVVDRQTLELSKQMAEKREVVEKANRVARHQDNAARRFEQAHGFRPAGNRTPEDLKNIAAALAEPEE